MSEVDISESSEGVQLEELMKPGAITFVPISGFSVLFNTAV